MFVQRKVTKKSRKEKEKQQKEEKRKNEMKKKKKLCRTSHSAHLYMFTYEKDHSP